MAYAVGCLIAPIFGGMFNDIVGFRYTCDIMAIAATVLSVFYFFINVLPKIIEDRAKKAQEIYYRAKYGNIEKKDKLILNKIDN